jgi:ubiquinol-cytochrome c reductase cytochrome b subunit
MISQLKKGLLATGRWLEDRTGLVAAIKPALTHLVPREARWWYIFGSATLCAFMVQVVTGIALAFAYVPSASQAYPTLQFITHIAPFGRVLRGMHYFGASAMVLMVGLHMARVFLTGSYKFPREMNWMTGVLLLVFTLVMGFTGQLLRWDQNAVWSVVVGAEQAGKVPFIGPWLGHFILGGDTMGGATLTRFFAIHVFIMPGLIFAFIGLHLWLVLRNGISEPPKAGKPVHSKTYRRDYEELVKRDGVPFFPHAAWRDAVFALVVVAGILLLAVIFGPPELDKQPDPSLIQASPHPDWYLLWYFAILALLPHGTEAAFIILFPMLVGAILFFLPVLFPFGERAPSRRPWAVAIVVFVVIMIATLWILGVREPWSPRFDAPYLPEKIVGTASGPVAEGARLFHDQSCITCHRIAGIGGLRGPDLTAVADRLSRSQIILRINNGAKNMPAYASSLKAAELQSIVAFLETRHQPGAVSSQPTPSQP